MPYVRSLPSGNGHDFKEIAEDLQRRNVRADIYFNRSGGRYYVIPYWEVFKLAHEEGQPYLKVPSREYGYGLWKETNESVEEHLREYNYIQIRAIR